MANDYGTLVFQTLVGGKDRKSDKQELLRSFRSMGQAVRVYRRKKGTLRAMICCVDASEKRILGEEDLAFLKEKLPEDMEIHYQTLRADSEDAGRDSAGVDCAFKMSAEADYIFLAHPSLVLEPTCLVEAMPCFEQDGVAIVEARQTPLSSTKKYDLDTGKTDEVCLECSVIKRDVLETYLESYKAVYREGNQEEEKRFCDQILTSGKQMIYCPSAIVYLPQKFDMNAGDV